MIQREIADRLRAEPGSRAYGSPSVLVQLACEVRLIRTVDPAVFRPRPRVESAILGLRADRARRRPRHQGLVRAAFAHRRKALPRSLEHVRPGARAAARPGIDRARLSGGCPRRGPFARAVRRPVREAGPMRIHAPAKVNLCLYLGPRRDDGLHELCSLFEPLLLSDPIDVEESSADEVVCDGLGRIGPLARPDPTGPASPGGGRPHRDPPWSRWPAGTTPDPRTIAPPPCSGHPRPGTGPLPGPGG